MRFGACSSLGSTGDARALDAILKVAKEGDSEMRSHAAEALGKFKPATDESVNGLIALLKDKDERVRLNAISGLGNIGPKAQTALPELERISKEDNDPDTREMARDARKRIISPQTKPSETPTGIFAPQ